MTKVERLEFRGLDVPPIEIRDCSFVEMATCPPISPVVFTFAFMTADIDGLGAVWLYWTEMPELADWVGMS